MWIAPKQAPADLVRGAVMAACSNVTFEGGGPISIEPSADRTTVPTGVQVNFTYNVKGTYIGG